MKKKLLEIAKTGDVQLTVIEARKLAKSAGFGEIDEVMIATAVSELARNILAYAGEGEVTIEILGKGFSKGIEIVAQDNGPGIADLEKAMEDNFSTGGGLGIGLPGVKRIMDEFTIYTKPGLGTKVAVRKWV
ncbi:MAG: anti-sigma regulatory factor [Deltaproteobacteria bacterium]|nr:anti-sigma regulatory factor [Deltaproteobacteria bacterium]MBW2077771.1 anti-sigma regulatory factor [Deltaproteobacteria bacterium]MBW2310136.1 anti-sigma regulatory factor [Deltaproteobacteria bacterium]